MTEPRITETRHPCGEIVKVRAEWITKIPKDELIEAFYRAQRAYTEPWTPPPLFPPQPVRWPITEANREAFRQLIDPQRQ